MEAVVVHYSLVSSPVLGFDLVRLPDGDGVADVLLRGLTAGPHELDVLAAQHDAVRREAAWQEVRGVAGGLPRLPEVLAQVGLELADPAATGPESVLRVLETSMLADADALVRLVHHDVLDWTWTRTDDVAVRTDTASRAADVLSDAAVATYLSSRLGARTRAALTTPYLDAVRQLDRVSPERGADDDVLPLAVLEVLHRVSALGEDGRARLRAAVATPEPPGAWSLAAHDASWAVHLTGRTRSAAAAQMRAVRAFGDAGLSTHDGAAGVWNAVSGAVHAAMVADLLCEASGDVLLRPWRAAFPRR